MISVITSILWIARLFGITYLDAAHGSYVHINPTRAKSILLPCVLAFSFYSFLRALLAASKLCIVFVRRIQGELAIILFQEKVICF